MNNNVNRRSSSAAQLETIVDLPDEIATWVMPDRLGPGQWRVLIDDDGIVEAVRLRPALSSVFDTTVAMVRFTRLWAEVAES